MSPSSPRSDHCTRTWCTQTLPHTACWSASPITRCLSGHSTTLATLLACNWLIETTVLATWETRYGNAEHLAQEDGPCGGVEEGSVRSADCCPWPVIPVRRCLFRDTDDTYWRHGCRALVSSADLRLMMPLSGRHDQRGSWSLGMRGSTYRDKETKMANDSEDRSAVIPVALCVGISVGVGAMLCALANADTHENECAVWAEPAELSRQAWLALRETAPAPGCPGVVMAAPYTNVDADRLSLARRAMVTGGCRTGRGPVDASSGARTLAAPSQGPGAPVLRREVPSCAQMGTCSALAFPPVRKASSTPRSPPVWLVSLVSSALRHGLVESREERR